MLEHQFPPFLIVETWNEEGEIRMLTLYVLLQEALTLLFAFVPRLSFCPPAPFFVDAPRLAFL